MEIKNIDLVQLDHKELELTNGGFPWGRAIQIAVTTYAVLSAEVDKIADDISDGFSAGYDAAAN